MNEQENFMELNSPRHKVAEEQPLSASLQNTGGWIAISVGYRGRR
jgi:hypothetical protein